jgi:hypothetical protein
VIQVLQWNIEYHSRSLSGKDIHIPFHVLNPLAHVVEAITPGDDITGNAFSIV